MMLPSPNSGHGQPPLLASAVAVQLSVMVDDLMQAAQVGDGEKVEQLARSLQGLVSTFDTNHLPEADQRLLRRQIGQVALAVDAAISVMQDGLRSRRIADRNMPAYRRAQSAGRF